MRLEGSACDDVGYLLVAGNGCDLREGSIRSDAIGCDGGTGVGGDEQELGLWGQCEAPRDFIGWGSSDECCVAVLCEAVACDPVEVLAVAADPCKKEFSVGCDDDVGGGDAVLGFVFGKRVANITEGEISRGVTVVHGDAEVLFVAEVDDGK